MTAKTASKTKQAENKETKTAKPVRAKEAKVEKLVAKKAEKVAARPLEAVVKSGIAPKVEQKSAVKQMIKSTEKKAATAGSGAPVAHGIGRRKAAVARVWLRRGGTGKIMVNDMPAHEYFSYDTARRMIKVPALVVPAAAGRYDVDANVHGGGVHGQADAIKLAISRALVKADETVRPVLKEQGLLRVDARVVERKKFGQKKARRRFQFVKR